MVGFTPNGYIKIDTPSCRWQKFDW